MRVLKKLKALGYDIELAGNKIHLSYAGEGNPLQEKVKPLIEELKNHKEEAIKTLKARQPSPYFTPDGCLVIPFESDTKYHWWKGGQSVVKTEEEVERWKQ